ncbi:tRNA (adenosine(37)-N6)-threonylcarbamoyltransferase complex dimerization subunit type 1 TsaB [Lactobacillus xylocopicola]|uniref:tRNA (Adenosine(37)-N6)-threonylcarbamoyltransferase complex dimerization subunit type 1 TsaB n=1 Tax=Lactobacillus xylocopicola TaxID=2976676 RepID=A0ABN6SK92_9LACO|nr:tRNA (adenosine(37)-N6)-threonylcarbamoyltransferase complex dimerization subunit type 1 TsaB [Lactobacillus xylocopicola]BDR60810.1 tRNA (adenosine(37)-N6)-threonylcarbamoyltransferase complex dimerization subunit type 1 TsaB [Lactobacillus xylocopicola]
MKVLSVSTATNHLSVALNEDQTILVEKGEPDRHNHSEHLDPLINQILTDQQLKLSEIDRFAVAIGPGSYTGLRIGVTTVKLFASILGKEVVGISTLAALAASCPDEDTLIVTGIDARNDNYFAGAYVNGKGQPSRVIADGHYHITTLLEAIGRYVNTERIKQVIFIGSGFKKQEGQIKQLGLPFRYGSDDQNLIHAGLIGKLALTAQPVDPDRLLPQYLRRTQAEVDWHHKTGQPYGPDKDYVEEV